MSQADELLDSLTEEQMAMYGVNPIEEPHIIINSDRTITVPDELKHIAVQGEHNIETVTFDCPRYWDGHDLSQMSMRIVYQRADGHREPYPIEKLSVDNTDTSTFHFDWTISGNVTAVKGNISFMVCAKIADVEGATEREWHSRVNQDLIIDEGLECPGDEIVEQNPDILESILSRLDVIESTGGVTDEQVANAVAAYLQENPVGTSGFVKTVNGVSPDENGDVKITIPGSGENVTGGGLSATQINALHGMFKVCLFDDSKDVSGAIAAFEAAFGITDSGGEDSGGEDSGGEDSGGEDSGGDDVTTYTISYELVNVSSSNNAASVAEGASYKATLAAADEFTLEGATVAITMGGADITAAAYADGAISIAAVTGNVEIMASAVQIEQEVEAVLPEGYRAFFDMRNRQASTTDHTTAYSLDPTDGEGMLYAWYASGVGDDYGAVLTNMTYSDSITANNEYAFGPTFTWSIHCYADAYPIAYPGGYGKFSNLTLIDYVAKYNTADGAASTEVVTGKVRDNLAGYRTYTVVSDGTALRIYLGADLVQTYDGADYEGFVSWYSVFQHNKTATCKTTAIALYDRALTEVELVEMVAYFKTLEVSA